MAFLARRAFLSPSRNENFWFGALSLLAKRLPYQNSSRTLPVTYCNDAEGNAAKIFAAS